MAITAIIGGQWGDEGKGKIVDLLSKDVSVVARFQGGANAGHTVYVDDQKLVLHQIPSGILREECKCILGGGMVIDPIELVQELKEVSDMGFSLDNIYISNSAHITTPIHRLIDITNEEKSNNKIGTTGRGIGPTYVDKYNRNGIRAYDLLEKKKLIEKLDAQLKNTVDSQTLTQRQLDEIKNKIDEFLKCSDIISKYIQDTFVIMHTENNILIEGAQGTMLDIDHGTYPFVTSSNPSSGGITTGLGVPLNKVNRLVGIFKAYITRVGNGPFPTELEDEDGEKIQNIGKEFGATTGRPRRCGWFDAPLAKYSCKLNGLTDIVLTKLDILDNFNEIQICTEYECDGNISSNLSEFMNNLHRVKPIYKTFKGWMTSTNEIKEFDNLPIEAKEYIKYIEELIETPVSIISTGPKREDIIIR